jgi:VPS13-like, N-terminal
MFERLISRVLGTYLGPYVQNLSEEQLKIGIWSGRVELRDLLIRQDALDAIRLPIVVAAGVLGTSFCFVLTLGLDATL